jgi:uncharacterized membrane protein YedE/YeeE
VEGVDLGMSVWALAGLIVGAGYGYVSQRGAFCMNSGFRMVVTERNTTKVKSYALAIALQMLVVPLVFALGLSSPTYPAMFPVGAVLGGLLFGASMRWAGGCAAGAWYKIGSGSLGALIAVVGMAVGAFAFELGPFVGLRTAIQSAGPSVNNAPLEGLWPWATVSGPPLGRRARGHGSAPALPWESSESWPGRYRALQPETSGWPWCPGPCPCSRRP